MLALPKQSSNSPSNGFTLVADGITKRFGSLLAVDRVSFRVKNGEVVGLLGLNGAGKTTTMRLLTNFYTPDSGRVLINGINPETNGTQSKQRIGYLPEGNPLYEDLLVSEYLAFVANLRGITGGHRKQRFDTIVEQTGIAEVFYRPIGELSRGNRQRIGLAQAILHEPEILILDEPTEGLDPNQRLAIRALIRSLGRDRTVVLSTHVLSEVEATCDRIMVINKGRLVADDTMANLQEAAASDEGKIQVEIEGPNAAYELSCLEDVTDVELDGVTEGRHRFIVKVVSGSDPRPSVFEMAKQKGFVLWGLSRDKASFENTFHSLTSDEGVGIEKLVESEGVGNTLEVSAGHHSPEESIRS